jgi:hypothetical protein
LAALAISCIQARGEVMYALTGNSLARFDTASPQTVSTVAITGTSRPIVAVDVRPVDGTLYGVAKDPNTGTSGSDYLYKINATSGAVTTLPGSTGTYRLLGTAFGMDFDPVADKVRVISNTGQNLRLDPNNGQTTGGGTTLAAPATVVAIAYSNNSPNPGATTLYGIDTSSGNLVLVGGAGGSPSPDGGTITVVGSLGLGSTLPQGVGFDISYTTGAAYLTVFSDNFSKLYSVDLASGRASLVGTIGTAPGILYHGLTAASGPQLVTATSPKLHEGTGVNYFSIFLPVSGPLRPECRSGGVNGDHLLVLRFDRDVVSGTAAVVEGVGSVSGTPTFMNGRSMTVNLTGVANAQTITLRLSNITATNGGVLPSLDLRVAYLLGDTNQNGTVNSTDITYTKTASGQDVGSYFRFDVNLSGSINASDIALVKSASGTTLATGSRLESARK